MVRIKDDGVFDASIDKIWKYLQDDRPEVHQHRAILGAKVMNETENQIVQEMELLNPDGKTSRKETWRLTFDPPRGTEIESLDGITKGTRYSNRYTAVGGKTRIEVEGDFKMQGMDDASTKKAALGFLAEMFDEDNANLKRYK
jgi:hypothetical protein